MIYRIILFSTLLYTTAHLHAQPPHDPLPLIQKHLDSLETTDHLSGVVLIAREGRSCFKKRTATQTWPTVSAIP